MKLKERNRVWDFGYEQYGDDIYDYYDKTKKSIIEYSESGEVIYEDYSKLDEYLNKVFIPEKEKSNNCNFCPEYKVKILLSDIIHLNLCFFEFCHVMDYLKERNILVVGELPNLDERFDNYVGIKNGRLGINTSYLDNFYTSNKYIKLSPGETMSKLIEYNDEKSTNYKNEVLRKEIIEGNIYLVNMTSRMLYISAFFKGIDMDKNELDSYGCEGLIYSVDTYNPKSGYSFMTYACRCIKYRILDGIYSSENKEYKRSEWAKNYYLCRKEIETTTGFIFKDNYELAYLINDLMYKKGYVGNTIKKNDNLNRILLIVQIPLEEFENNVVFESSFDVEKEVRDKELKELLNMSFNDLKNREREVIEYRYGFADGRKHTLEETGKVLNVTRERVRQIEDRAIRKLRRPSISSKLKAFY